MSVLRPITPEKEAGLEPVGWSWECEGGMVNCFPSPTSWDYERPERNRYWADRGFTAPRPLYFQTPLQKAAPELLAAAESALETAESLIREYVQGSRHFSTAMAELDQVRKTIAKARGDA